MSVLINMAMPTSCYDCNCFIRDSDGSDYCCLLMIDIENNNKRDDDCPLVSVPPHGRLIDVEAPLRFEVAIDAKMHHTIVDIYAPTVIDAEDGES